MADRTTPIAPCAIATIIHSGSILLQSSLWLRRIPLQAEKRSTSTRYSLCESMSFRSLKAVRCCVFCLHTFSGLSFSADSPGAGIPLRSGTIAQPSITQCGITFRPCVQASASRSAAIDRYASSGGRQPRSYGLNPVSSGSASASLSSLKSPVSAKAIALLSREDRNTPVSSLAAAASSFALMLMASTSTSG
jgi:hypothetical protein